MGYIRDLAGIKTSDGKTIKPDFLIRSAQLDKPSADQIEYLKNIKLKKIIDLRNEAEAAAEPDYSFSDVKYMNVSIIDNDLNGVAHTKDRKKQMLLLKQLPEMIVTYEKMLTDDYSLKAIKKVIREIVLKDEFPTLYHCVTGKDRVGVISAILLKMLNVPQETIVEDYMKQYDYYIGTARKYYLGVILFSLDLKQAKKVYDYYAIKPDYIEKALDTIYRNFGSFDRFIHDYIELSDEDVEAFRNKVLE